jgi:hypothetical protein
MIQVCFVLEWDFPFQFMINAHGDDAIVGDVGVAAADRAIRRPPRWRIVFH